MPKKREPAAADATIFRQFVSRPREVGAVRRSSPALGIAMANAVRWPEDRAVIEAGPGDGAITEHLLAVKPAATPFLAVELNEACAHALERRLPDLKVVVDDLANLCSICTRESVGEVGVVVATLPWSVIPENKRAEMLEAVLETLTPDGQFLFYIYVQALPFWRRSPFAQLLHERFETIEHGSVVWKNVPPAVVFDCRGPSGS
jgi:phospholipid N-methyltransferase